MELYKFLQQQGFGSRKQCRELVARGRVELDGRPVDDPARPVDPAAPGALRIDGEAVTVYPLPLYLLLHKPADCEVSHRPGHYPSVFGYLPAQMVALGLSAVGRLDADTTGLLLFATDGAFVHALTSPRRHVAKRYRVTLKHPAGADLLDRLSAGVVLHDDDTPVRADAVALPAPTTLLLTISEGRYHQVKRMVAAAGNRVVALHREAVGALELGELPVGQWRFLTRDELALLGV